MTSSSDLANNLARAAAVGLVSPERKQKPMLIDEKCAELAERPNWNECEHEWVLSSRDFDLPEGREEVVCIHCDCPGECNTEDGSVFWPTT